MNHLGPQFDDGHLAERQTCRSRQSGLLESEPQLQVRWTAAFAATCQSLVGHHEQTPFVSLTVSLPLSLSFVPFPGANSPQCSLASVQCESIGHYLVLSLPHLPPGLIPVWFRIDQPSVRFILSDLLVSRDACGLGKCVLSFHLSLSLSPSLARSCVALICGHK